MKLNIDQLKQDIPFLDILFHFKNYFSASMAKKVLGFLSIPVLTRLLDPTDYGILNVFSSSVSVFTILFSLNIHSAVGRYYYEEKDDFKEFFTTSALMTGALMALLALVFFFLREPVLKLINLPLSLWVFILPAAAFMIANSLFNQVFMPQSESKKVARLQIIQTYATFGLTVALLLLLPLEKYKSCILAGVLVSGGAFVYIAAHLKNYISLHVQWAHIRYALVFALPLIPNALSGILLHYFDRIMVNTYTGNHDAGLYSFAYNIGMLIYLVIGAFVSSWMPKFNSYLNHRQYDQLDRDVRHIFRIIVFLAIGLIYFSQELGMVLAKKNFHAALPVVPLVAIGYTLYFIYVFYSRTLFYIKQTGVISFITLFWGGVNILLNWLFIPKYGYMAGAVTTIVSYAGMSVMCYIFNKYVFKCYTTRLAVMLPPLIIFALWVGFYYALIPAGLNYWLFLFIKAVLTAALGAVLFYSQISTLLKKLNP